jgi:hypothetical protein
MVHRYFAAFSRSAIFRSNDRAPMGPLKYVFFRVKLSKIDPLFPILTSFRVVLVFAGSSPPADLRRSIPGYIFRPLPNFGFFSPTCPYSGTDALSASPLCALSLHFNSRHSQRAISSIDFRFRPTAARTSFPHWAVRTDLCFCFTFGCPSDSRPEVDT